MLFLFSLFLAAAFSVFCGEALRKHPAPFYTVAALLSICTVCAVQLHPSGISPFIQNVVIALFSKGTLATAFWAVVMWTGALPNGSSLMKRLMPQRGQLSVFAAILTLGHAVGFMISYFPRWLKKADALNLMICIALLLIMIPLTVISVQKIRRTMKAKTWKSVQRWAYLFYALIPVHVIALNYAKARNGHKGAVFSLLLYAAVFLGYAVCRIRKQYLRMKKPEHTTTLNVLCGTAFAVLFAGAVLAALPKHVPEAVQTNTAALSEQTGIRETTAEAPSQTTAEAAETTAAQSETDESGTTVTTETETGTVTDPVTAAEEASDDSGETEAAVTEAPSEASSQVQNTEAPLTEAPVQQTAPPAETEPPAPARMYQDGTFTANAYGYDGNITVHVTIQDDRITDITAETEESDDAYFFDAKSVVIPAILRSQAPDVDACSGATYSSNGIMAAVRTALEQARI